VILHYMSRRKLLKIQTCKNAVLLFRAKIEHVLEITPTDCSLVGELKENMQRSLDHRMPVTDLQVTAAMLDPSQRNLSAVQKFFAARSYCC